MMILVIGFLILITIIEILLLSIDSKLDKLIKYHGLDKKKKPFKDNFM